MKTELARLEAQLRQHIEGYPPGSDSLNAEGVLMLRRIMRLRDDTWDGNPLLEPDEQGYIKPVLGRISGDYARCHNRSVDEARFPGRSRRDIRTIKRFWAWQARRLDRGKADAAYLRHHRGEPGIVFQFHTDRWGYCKADSEMGRSIQRDGVIWRLKDSQGLYRTYAWAWV